MESIEQKPYQPTKKEVKSAVEQMTSQERELSEMREAHLLKMKELNKTGYIYKRGDMQPFSNFGVLEGMINGHHVLIKKRGPGAGGGIQKIDNEDISRDEAWDIIKKYEDLAYNQDQEYNLLKKQREEKL